jgi:hypothetical protein
MNLNQLQAVIVSRLEDLANQCQFLTNHGNFAEAELIRAEGMALAAAFDDEEDFLYVDDLKLTR